MKWYFFFILIITACNLSKEKSYNNAVVDKNIIDTILNVNNDNENFDIFYTKFYRDSLFQISRIKFPLEGDNSNFIYNDEILTKELETPVYKIENKTFYWKKDGWMFIKTFEKDSIDDYFKELKKSKRETKEVISLKYSGFKSTRMFRVIDGNWYLVYYTLTDY